MTPKERHFELMKAAVNGLATRYNIYETDGVLEDARLRLANNALCIADAALAEFNKRWPEEEKADNCHHLNRSKAAMADHPWHCNVCGKEF